MSDDLSAPLGQNEASKRRRTIHPAVPQVAAAAILSLLVAAVVGWAMLGDDPLGGEPVAVVPVSLNAGSMTAATKTSEDPARLMPVAASENRSGAAVAAGAMTSPPRPPGRTITIIDGTSGKRQEVLIPETAPSNITADAVTPLNTVALPVKPIAKRPKLKQVTQDPAAPAELR
ncbi:MAG: hypothetical protein ACJ8F3_21530 [Xanthobacteraceae bacterium]